MRIDLNIKTKGKNKTEKVILYPDVQTYSINLLDIDSPSTIIGIGAQLTPKTIEALVSELVGREIGIELVGTRETLVEGFVENVSVDTSSFLEEMLGINTAENILPEINDLPQIRDKN